MSPRSRDVGTLRVRRPADYLPPWTVGQWVDCKKGRRPQNRPSDAGGCLRTPGLATQRERDLTATERGTLKTAWVATVHQKGGGAQEPRCARSEGRCGAVGFYVVVAATAGPRARREFTPLRQLRPPEVCPLVSHGRLDTGTSALEDTADLDFDMVADYAHLKYGQRSPWFWWSYLVCRMWSFLHRHARICIFTLDHT